MVRRSLVGLLLLLCSASPSLASSQWQSGDQYWSDQFGLPMVDGTVYCAIQYQGKLVIGGRFQQVGDVAARNLAIWDGTSWNEIEGGTSGPVYALLVDQGDLIVGGGFARVGAIQARGVARWNGTKWQAYGDGLGQQYSDGEGAPARALAMYQGTLVAGGEFNSTGPFTLPFLARWDGTAWLPMALIDGPVYALAVAGDSLYVGGAFSSVNSDSARAVALWDGGRWSRLPGLNPGPFRLRPLVRTLLRAHGLLYAGGEFGDGYTKVAAWTGSAWEPVGSFGYGVNCLAADGDTLFVGEWYGIGSWPPDPYNYRVPGITGTVYGITWYGSHMVAVGDIEARTESDSLLALSMALRHNGGWSGLVRWDDPMHGLTGGSYTTIGDLEPYRGELVATGSFTYAGASGRLDRVGPLAAWNGSSWRAFPGPAPPCYANGPELLLADADTLYVAGTSYCYDSTGSHRVAVMRFDGTGWAPFDPLPIYPTAIARYAGSLYVAGNVDSYPQWAEVYRLNGTQWIRVGFTAGTYGGIIRTMVVYQDRLIVAGYFEGMNNRAMLSIASWDGTHWDPVGSLGGYFFGPPYIESMTVHRSLLVAGASTYNGTVFSWDGSRWTRMGYLNAEATRLASVGGELFIGGRIRSYAPYEGFRVDGIARWTGRDWEFLGSGLNNSATTLEAFRGSLFVGGQFTRAGNHASFGIAQWNGLKSVIGAPRVALAPGAPNPFRTSASFRLQVNTTGDVRVSVHDVRGRELRVIGPLWRERGEHVVSWDGRDVSGKRVASGVYYVRVHHLEEGTVTSQRIVFLR